MNISLRKANALQNGINDAIRSIDLKMSVDLNEFQDPSAVLQKANEELFLNDSRRQKLLLALYNIRALVGTANSQSGIDTNLAKAAFADKRIGQLDEIAKCQPMLDLPIINGKLQKISKRPDDTRSSLYGRDEVVTTSVITNEQIQQAKSEIKNLKKQKQKINDEVLELNIKTEIPLSEDVVTTLTDEGLL